MNPKLPFIEKYIIKHHPTVDKVYFTQYNSWLGSSPELPDSERSVNVTRINIVVDNSNETYTPWGVRSLAMQIRNEIDSYFNLDLGKYGSKYDTEFYVKSVSTLTDYLKKK
jgi:hypothetical protein